MGGCCGKDDKEKGKALPGRAPIQGTSGSTQKAKAKAIGGGNILGGAKVESKEDARQRQLAAAEARQKENENRGLGSESKAKELKEKHEKEELVGKIKAWYELKKEEAPMGLGLASVEQLRATYQRLSSSQ